MNLRAAVIASAMMGLVAACSQDAEIPLDQREAEDLLTEARQLRNAGRPLGAAELFVAVDRYHPYSSLAKTALINASNAYFDGGNFDKARETAEIFVDYYPADELTAQARYLIAMSYYSVITDVGRDQSATQDARNALEQVIAAHPQSPYARQARFNLDLTLDHLAGKEMEVGRFYLNKQHYTAAINRFRIVVEDYSSTSHAPEALHRLVEIYLALGLDNQAVAAGAVLGHNYQASEWYAQSYALLGARDASELGEATGWIGQIYRQVVLGEWL